MANNPIDINKIQESLKKANDQAKRKSHSIYLPPPLVQEFSRLYPKLSLSRAVEIIMQSVVDSRAKKKG